MKIYVKYHRIINVKNPSEPGKDDGDQLNLTPGFHSVDDRLSDHWFFKGLVKAGDIMVMDQESAIVVEEKKEKPSKK